jgi:hypothetical protein
MTYTVNKKESLRYKKYPKEKFTEEAVIYAAVLWIRIHRIRMFLGLQVLDPSLFVRIQI